MKKGKKLIAIIVGILMIAALAITVAACSPSDTNKVFFVSMDQMDLHWSNVNNGCKDAVTALKAGTATGYDKKVEIDYYWVAPDQKDSAKQNEAVNNSVARGAKVILLACNSTGINSVLDEADAKGVKIIYVDSGADWNKNLQIISTDNKAAGKKAGEAMLAALAAAEVASGNIGIIGVKTDTASTVAREEGFREALKDKGFTLLTTQFQDGDATKSQNAAQSFITANSVVGIFGTNEGSTVGACNAAADPANASKKPIVVGFDMTPTIQGFIDSGILYGTVQQAPYQMGYKGVVSAASVIVDGKIVGEKSTDSGCEVVKKAA